MLSVFDTAENQSNVHPKNDQKKREALMSDMRWSLWNDQEHEFAIHLVVIFEKNTKNFADSG